MLRKHLCSKTLLLSLAALLFTVTQAHAQCKPHEANPLSPAAETSATLDGKTVTVYYCAPSMRGRKIMGALVPFDKVWRTGANTSTTLKTDSDLRIGKQMVPAGTYTLYTLPSAGTWQLIVNKQVGQWGTVYNQSQDLARIPMMTGPAPASPVETFKIYFEQTHGKKTQLHLTWESTDVYVPVKAIK